MDALRDDEAGERYVRTRDGLREREHVGLHAPVLKREPTAGASETGNDFVGDQQHVVAVADLA